MKPVAWMDREGDIMPTPEIPNWCPPHTMLYSAGQLRQAKVEVLREAAQQALELGGFISQLNLIRMADEIEKGE